jgi:hypothetical protein
MAAAWPAGRPTPCSSLLVPALRGLRSDRTSFLLLVNVGTSRAAAGRVVAGAMPGTAADVRKVAAAASLAGTARARARTHARARAPTATPTNEPSTHRGLTLFARPPPRSEPLKRWSRAGSA